MKVTSVEKKEKNTVELTVQVDAETFEAAVQKAYLKNRGRINVPGFRKGKAPRKIIEGMYGSGVFYEDAVNSIYPDAYAQAVKEQSLDDVGYPKVELQEVGKDGFTFKALVSVRPEVKLGTYKGLTAEKAEVEITDADIEGELQPFIDRATRLVTVDRAARNGDTVVIDFEGFDNGTPFEGGKGTNYELKLGSGSFIPGFEEQLAGMKTGEEKDLDITFPEDYHKDLAGKAVVFHVKVSEVKESQVPDVDDEFAKDVSEFETLSDFKKDLGEKLKARREEQVEDAFANAVVGRLIDGMECEIPDGMVEVRQDRLMEEYAMRLQSQGLSLETYMQMMGMSADAMRDSVRPSALRQLQTELALGAVADAEGLEVTQEEQDAEFQKLAERYGMEVDKVKEALPAEDLVRDLRLKKASDFVVAAAKVGKPEKKAAPKDEGEGEPAEGKAGESAGEKPKRTRKKKAEQPEED